MKRRAVIPSLADEEAARIRREKILEVIYGPIMFILERSVVLPVAVPFKTLCRKSANLVCLKVANFSPRADRLYL